MKIGALIAPYGPARGMVIGTYSSALEKLHASGFDIELHVDNMLSADQSVVDPDPDFLFWLAEKADLILAHVPPAYDALIDEIKKIGGETGKPVVPIAPECAKLANGVSPKEFKTLWAYNSNGGVENIANLIHHAMHITGHAQTPAPPPVELPSRGIYHPDADSHFDSLDDYQAWRPAESGAPTIGLFFPRTYWIENSLKVYDALIRELESNGANVIAVFNDKFRGGGDDIAIEQFFMRDGAPVVDAVVFQAYFFLKSSRSGADVNHEETDILNRLNVPALLMINTMQSGEEYAENPEGLTVPQYIIAIALPEFDGISEPVLVGVSESKLDRATGAKMQVPVPIDAQVGWLVSRVLKWCALRKKPVHERKVAIIFHNSPCRSGVEATVGSGFGLDTLESVALLLQRMKKEGYDIDWVPESGKELIDTILEKKAISEFRWTPLSEIVKRGGAAGFVELATYREWLGDLPGESRRKVFDSWGDPFNGGLSQMKDLEKMSLALHEGKITIPGLRLGNVFIGLQPKRGCAGARCDGSVCKMLHDPEAPPPHQYLCYYKWIEKDFGADAMIHVGTHGNIELLPGKSVGLSPSCFSRFAVGSLPHLYIYVVSNPMEGSIAKRRGLAVIVDHLHPVMAATKLYGPLEELEDPLEEYSRARGTNDRGRMKELESIIAEKAQQASIVRGPETFPDFDAFVDYLHGQMELLTETMFRDGLHILGRAPDDRQLVTMLSSVLRFDQGRVPSIRRWIIESLGLDYDTVLDHPESMSGLDGITNSKVLKLATEASEKIIGDALEKDEPADTGIISSAKDIITELFSRKPHIDGNGASAGLIEIVRYGLDLVPLIRRTTDEIENLLRGLNGEFIEPGASGALARGKVETLPTGRNFYSIDPFKIPTPAAWNVGIKLANNFFHKYQHEHDHAYPENIGFVFRFFDVFRADGEQLAQMLYTMGVRPVWDGARITKLEVIPLEELGRPRVDVTVQLSNMLRDGCPRAFELVDEAVQLVAELDEPPDKNYVRKHVLERLEEMKEEEDEKKKMRFATFRVFTAAPGVYDYGSNTAVASSAWETEDDLGEIFIETCHYAYGKGVFGVKAPDDFRKNLERTQITYDKWDSDEYDILECCHLFGSHGGFTQAAKTASGKDVKVYFADTNDPDRPRIRDMEEELDRVARTRLLNPEWIESKKRHGYKGGTVMSDRIFHMYGWQATTRLVGNWVFDEIAEKFVLDEESRKWFRENNMYALESIARRLIEAESRELWKADPETLEQIRDVYLDIESWLEDTMDETDADFQGSAIEIIKSARMKTKDES